ncbi:MAG TPA: efflux RND transporter periplasmic adaptor subunit [Burkholderiales bacterium]|nr:efflux RND transporter periplasmic adaptor subunit [Burkholderiales bacterium]
MKSIRTYLAVLACLYSFSALGARPLLCLIQPDSEAEIGSPVVGVVDSILVERGDKVKKGQVLARLRSHVEAASLRVAKTRAEADADVRAAEANYLYLRQQQTRSEELFGQKFISAAALEKSRAETKVAEEKFAQARKQLDVWKREVDLANAQLQLRAIRSPFSGVIVERHASLGERIEDKSLFRVARLDLLRVEVVVPASMFGTITKGMIARVTPTLPNAEPLDAEIVLIDHYIDSASNTFRVRATLPNADGKIPPGSRCSVELIDAPVSAQNQSASVPVEAPPSQSK